MERVCVFLCVRACVCYQCLTGGRLWLLLSGTVRETNDISTPKGAGKQIYRSLFEELKTQLYRKGEVMSVPGRRRRRGQRNHSTEIKKGTMEIEKQNIEGEKLAQVNTGGER